MSYARLGKFGDDGLLWQGGDGVGLPVPSQPPAVEPITVDSCDADDTVDVGVENVGVSEGSLGAQRMSLQAGSDPSPTKMS